MELYETYQDLVTTLDGVRETVGDVASNVPDGDEGSAVFEIGINLQTIIRLLNRVSEALEIVDDELAPDGYPSEIRLPDDFSWE